MSRIVNVVVLLLAASRMTNGLESSVCADGSALLQAKISNHEGRTGLATKPSCEDTGYMYYYEDYHGYWGYTSRYRVMKTVCNTCDGGCGRMTQSPTPPTIAPTPSPTPPTPAPTPAPTWNGEPSDLKKCPTLSQNESCSSMPGCSWSYSNQCDYAPCAWSACESQEGCVWKKSIGPWGQICMPDVSTPRCLFTGMDYYYYTYESWRAPVSSTFPYRPTRCNPGCRGQHCNLKCLPIQSKEECKKAAQAQEDLQWDGTRRWVDRSPGCLKTIADGNVNWNSDYYGYPDNPDQEPLCA